MGRLTKYVECDGCGLTVLRERTGSIPEVPDEVYCEDKCLPRMKGAVERVRNWRPDRRGNGNERRTPGVL